MMRTLLPLFLVLLLGGVVFAGSSSGGVNNIVSALEQLCSTAVSILGAAIVLLIVLAAIIYGIGQVMGAETRARASVWATSMIVGAIIAILLYVLLPWLLGLISGGSFEVGSGGCSATLPSSSP